MTKLPMSIKETSIFCQLSFLHICTLMRPEAWQGPGSKLDAENFYKIFLHHSLVFVRSWNIKTHYGQTNYSSKHLMIVSKYSTSQTPQKTNEISTSQKYIANFPFRETKDQVIFHFFSFKALCFRQNLLSIFRGLHFPWNIRRRYPNIGTKSDLIQCTVCWAVLGGHCLRFHIIAISALALRWMRDSPRTRCARRTTPIYTWREQAIIEWSRRVISIVACCHSAKLCALAARDFQSQHINKNYCFTNGFDDKGITISDRKPFMGLGAKSLQ